MPVGERPARAELLPEARLERANGVSTAGRSGRVRQSGAADPSGPGRPGALESGGHFNLGVIAEQRGRPAVAVREYRAEVAAHPDAFKAWVNLGLLERQAGRIDAALAAFDKASSAGANEVAGPYLMAETLADLGRRPEARRWAQEAVRRRPNNLRAQELLQRVR